MTTGVQNNLIPYVPGVFLMRPKKLKDYFQRERSLQIPAKYSFCFWMDKPSAEWSSNAPLNLNKVVRVFNEFLPGKSCKVVSDKSETITIEALDDGFYLSTKEHPFRIIVK